MNAEEARYRLFTIERRMRAMQTEYQSLMEEREELLESLEEGAPDDPVRRATNA